MLLGLTNKLTVEVFYGSLELLLVLCQALFLTLNHTERVMLVGKCLVFAINLILQVRYIVRSNLELALKFNDLVLSFDAVL